MPRMVREYCLRWPRIESIELLRGRRRCLKFAISKARFSGFEEGEQFPHGTQTESTISNPAADDGALDERLSGGRADHGEQERKFARRVFLPAEAGQVGFAGRD